MNAAAGPEVEPKRAAAAPRVLVEIAVWWALSLGVWLMSLSAVSSEEYIVAVLASLPCGVAAAGARWAIGESWTLRPAWLAPALLLPVAVFTDAAQVLASPLWSRRRGGRFSTIATGHAGDSARARAGRAVATMIVSTTPGTYVLDIDPDSGEMLVHSLAPKGPSVEKAVAA